MLIGLNIGAWMIDGVTIGWYLLKLILLAVIAWQIGVGLRNRWKVRTSNITAGAISAIAALALGAITGITRYLDETISGGAGNLK